MADEEVVLTLKEQMDIGQIKDKVYKVCLQAGHNYIAVEDSDFRDIQGNDTHIRRSFICTKCGYVIQPIVAIWQNFVAKKRS